MVHPHVSARLVSMACLWVLPAVHGQTLAVLQQDYVDQEYGMFLHFNMGTFTEEQWTDPNQPLDTFNPVGLDTDQWAAAAAAAGMTYGVLTTKHHDGFALWDTSQSTYDVSGTTWYADAEAAEAGSGDIVKRFADSFRAQGLNVGLYYSIWDRTNGIDEPSGTLNGTDATAHVKAELTELLTNYGFITCIWTDGWGWRGDGYNYVDYTEVYNHIKTLSPNTLLVENNHTEFNTDIKTWEQNLPPANNTLPSEMSFTIRSDNKWFWESAGASGLESAATLFSQRQAVNAANAAYLLNVSPDQSGLIPADQVARLAEVAALEASQLPSTVLSLTANAAGSATPGFGSSLPGTLTDGFAYDPAYPTAALPNGNFDASITVGFHANEANGVDAILNYDLSGGAHTTAAAEPIIVVDLYGRNEARFLGDPEPNNEASRDNDVDVILLLGGVEVANVEGVMIDGADGAHGRATFDSLVVGTQFDAVRLVAHDSDGGLYAANYFTLAEVRVASTGVPPLSLADPSVSSITGTGAEAGAELENAAADDVTLFWDTVDQGTGTWSQSLSLGARSPGPVSGSIAGLQPDTEYFFRFRAVDTTAEPDVVAWSGAGTSFATALTGLSPASALAWNDLVPDPKTQIDVEWTDVFNTENGFVVERSLNGIDGWAVVGTAGADQEFFYDSNLFPGTTYYYRVFAENGAGLSDPSAVVSATTDPATPGLQVLSWFRMGDDGKGAADLPLDSSGNGYDLEVNVNSPDATPASGGGYDNDAYYRFNGTDQAFHGITGFDPPEDNVGVEVWVRTSNLVQNNAHVFGTGSNNTGLNLGYTDAGGRGWFGAVGGVAFVGSVGTTGYTAGEWIHLAVVRESGVSTFYVNGQPNGTSTAAPNDAFQDLHIALASSAEVYFQGDLAEARVFFFDAGEFDVADLLFPSLSAPDAYGSWAGGFPGLTNPDASLDFDMGGLDTGIEWVTGGDPADGGDDATVAPVIDNSSDPDALLFTFRRRDAAEADPNTTIHVDYGSDLDTWRNTIDHGAIDGVAIDDTTDLGGGFHQVTVSIPRAVAAGGRLFARLRVEISTP